jgi:hypothetical protein
MSYIASKCLMFFYVRSLCCCFVSCMCCVRCHVAMLCIISLLPSYIHTQKKNCTCYVRLDVIANWEGRFNLNIRTSLKYFNLLEKHKS